MPAVPVVPRRRPRVLGCGSVLGEAHATAEPRDLVISGGERLCTGTRLFSVVQLSKYCLNVANSLNYLLLSIYWMEPLSETDQMVTDFDRAGTQGRAVGRAEPPT